MRRPAQNMSGEALVDLLEALREQGSGLCFSAGGQSMLPAIRDGDLVTVSTTGSAPIRRGTVVAFREPRSRRLMVHRIISVYRDGYLVRGDNVRMPDGFITPGDILGAVTRVERNGRAIWIASPGHGLVSSCLVWAYLLVLDGRFLARAFLMRLRGHLARVWRTSAGCGGTG